MIANEFTQQLTRLEPVFGMTPSARTRIHVKPQETADPTGKARFFA